MRHPFIVRRSLMEILICRHYRTNCAIKVEVHSTLGRVGVFGLASSVQSFFCFCLLMFFQGNFMYVQQFAK